MRDLRTTAVALAVAGLLAGGGAGCVVETREDATLTVVNDSSYALIDLRVARVGSRSWGRNLLPDVLFPGDSITVHGIRCGRYDVLVTDETGVDCVLGDLSLCFSDDIWYVDDVTLDACAFSP